MSDAFVSRKSFNKHLNKILWFHKNGPSLLTYEYNKVKAADALDSDDIPYK